MWKEFSARFGTRIEGFHSAQEWVEEMRTWFLIQKEEAKSREQRAALLGCAFGSVVTIIIFYLSR